MCSSQNIIWGDQIKKNEIGRECCTYERQKRVSMGRPDGNRLLGRPRLRLENNIKMDLQEVGWEGMDWIAVAEDGDRRRPSGSVQCRELRD